MATTLPLTLADARTELARWMDALQAAATGSSYAIAGRSLTRQNIPEIRGEIRRWHNTVLALEARGRGVARALGAQASFPAPGGGAGSGLLSNAQWVDPKS